MKKIFLMALIASTLAHAESSNVSTCKAYINEAKSFQKTMDTSKVSQATFSFYKDNVVTHCGNIVTKLPYENNFFAKALMKKDTTTVSNCKLAIKMAKAYDINTQKSSLITQAHKINMIDNCGTLIAKKAPAFCLFDNVDNSKETLKEKCLSAIDQAHATIDSGISPLHREAVLVNCGRLHATL